MDQSTVADDEAHIRMGPIGWKVQLGDDLHLVQHAPVPDIDAGFGGAETITASFAVGALALTADQLAGLQPGDSAAWKAARQGRDFG